MHKFQWSMLSELAIRLTLWLLFLWIESSDPFIRVIQENELWLYQYPSTRSIVPQATLWVIIILIPSIVYFVDYYFMGKTQEVANAALGMSLAMELTAICTSFLKILVGRPRPDFYYRCFPDGKGSDFNHCTGIRRQYMDGRKSFPSGHASLSFASMLFLSFYWARKFSLYENIGKAWQLCICFIPVLLATAISVSRTCDYHHHYEDVAAGAVLGSVISYLCFKLYFAVEETK